MKQDEFSAGTLLAARRLYDSEVKGEFTRQLTNELVRRTERQMSKFLADSAVEGAGWLGQAVWGFLDNFRIEPITLKVLPRGNGALELPHTVDHVYIDEALAQAVREQLDDAFELVLGRFNAPCIGARKYFGSWWMLEELTPERIHHDLMMNAPTIIDALGQYQPAAADVSSHFVGLDRSLRELIEKLAAANGTPPETPTG